MRPTKSNIFVNRDSDRISFAITVADLIDRGYNHKFRRETSCLFCMDNQKWFWPTDFSVNEIYEFGANAHPDVERLVYAITTHSGTKGILVDSYGVYTDNISKDMFRKLRLRNDDIGRKEQRGEMMLSLNAAVAADPR